ATPGGLWSSKPLAMEAVRRPARVTPPGPTVCRSGGSSGGGSNGLGPDLQRSARATWGGMWFNHRQQAAAPC
ncbi:unnamed protein product, partial [Amoebophrya sp. A120]